MVALRSCSNTSSTPHAHDSFAATVRNRLQIPVDCPAFIEDGTTQRFLRWHTNNAANQTLSYS